MKQYYKEEELTKNLVRPLNIGDWFLVKDKLTEDSNDEMEELCSTWVEVVDSGDFLLFQLLKMVFTIQLEKTVMNGFGLNFI